MTSQEPPTDIRAVVRDRYGKIAAQSSSGCCGSDRSASSCCNPESSIQEDRLIQIYETSDFADLPVEVTDLSLGCGDPVTLASLEPGQTVLDLGSGGGIDCFLAAKKVGEDGFVIGVDMTPEMIEKARQNKDRLGAKNVEFRLGEIEHLPIADSTVDVIISNCVINLSPDKPQVFREAFRALKPGGKLSVSDIVTDGPLPDEIKRDLSAWAGCVAGAWSVEDYVAAIEAAGFINVALAPVYLEKETIDEAVAKLDLPANLVSKDEALYKTIFSAKITARKP